MAAAPGANICSKDISRELIRSDPGGGVECSGAPNPAPEGGIPGDCSVDEVVRWSGWLNSGKLVVRCSATGVAVGTAEPAEGAKPESGGTGTPLAAPSSGAVVDDVIATGGSLNSTASSQPRHSHSRGAAPNSISC